MKPDRIERVGSIKFDPDDVRPRPGDASCRSADARGRRERARSSSRAAPTRAKKKFWRKSSWNCAANFPGFFFSSHRATSNAPGRSPPNCATSACPRRGEAKPRPAARSIVSFSIPPANCATGIRVGTIVFIGKSLTARGGQNPVEAIVADCPVVFGPHMENFAALARDLVVAGRRNSGGRRGCPNEFTRQPPA